MNNQEKVITGNYFNKHESKNILYQMLVKNYRLTLQDLVRDLSFNNCLEIGSGEGYILEYLHKVKPNIKFLGSEINYSICELGRTNNPYANWAVMIGENLAVKTSSFDLVVACEVLEHIKDPIIVLNEMYRVSSKFVLLSVPYEPIWRLLNLLRLKYLKALGNTPGHINHWSPKNISGLVSEYFHIIKIRVSFPWIFITAEKTDM
ncbi:MAG: class I SAM-dependent methyltransferase [Bellilinea sp.]